MKRSIRTRRIGVIEQLEARQLLTAEGTPFNLSQIYDTSALGGTVSAVVDWGDGQSSVATIANQPVQGALRIRFDYSLDTAGFFNDPVRRDLLQRAADSITSKLSDTLTAIAPSGINSWTARFQDPSTGINTTRVNMSLPANEILVFAGGRAMPTGQLGFAHRGGTSSSGDSQAFVDNVSSRGQAGALSSPPTDFGPWGGSLALSTSANWHFGSTTSGLDSNEFDFMTVAQHELLHILGFGTSESFDAKISGSGFTGANAVAVAGVSPVPLADPDHLPSSVGAGAIQSIMSPGTTIGLRKSVTRLDLAVLQDIGWQLLVPNVQVSADHIYGDNGTLQGQVRLQGSSYGEVTYPLQVVTTNVAPTLQAPANQTVVTGVPISLPAIGLFTDPGFGFPSASPPVQESFTYSIDWGDQTPSTTGGATVTRVGSPGVLTEGTFGGEHTYGAPGNYTVTLRVTDDDGGSAQQQFSILVSGVPELTMSIDRNRFAENAGQNAATLTIQRTGFPLNSPLQVTLTSSDTTEVALPATVTFEAGQETIQVPVHAVDDTLLDGLVRVQLQGIAGTVSSNVAEVEVEDHETITIVANRTTFGEHEGAGVSVIEVTRSNTDVDQAIVVTLVSSDTSELTLPASVTIPAGQRSTTVGVNAVDDALFDGNQTVIVSASATNYTGSSIEFVVTDYQPISLAAEPSTGLFEDEPARRAGTIELEIRSPAPAGGVTLQLSANPPNQLSFPASVVIPAGETRVTVPVEAIDDAVPQGQRSVQVTASGPGMLPATVSISVFDEDVPYWTNLNEVFDIDGDGDVGPLDALAIINPINQRGSKMLSPENDRDLLFVDPNMDGSMDPLDVLYVINEINRRMREG